MFILPVPSIGESAPAFSTSAGFDILISVTGRHADKQQSVELILKSVSGGGEERGELSRKIGIYENRRSESG